MPETKDDLVRFKHPLPHLAESLKSRRKVRIVAIGSSSTAWEGKILPYPGRLEMVLRNRFHDRMIDVLNRGVSGQEATDELSRFDSDVVEEAPALVIWQVGTNAVYRNQDYNPDDVIASIVTGLERLSFLPMDVMLMDLQFTTAIVGPDKLKLSEQMVARIADVAEKANVNVFRRFALMRRWVDDYIPIENLIDPADGSQLHMSDWCTNCITQVLDVAMAGAPVG
jgi:acyl-CoA thioesterase-1